MKITIAKALKLKNSLVGEIKELQSMIVQHNVQREDVPALFDVKVLKSELDNKRGALMALKTMIQQANYEIQSLLISMAEWKGEVTFLRTIPTKEGEMLERESYGEAPVKVVYVSSFGAVWQRDEIKRIEKLIRETQDTVDEYNASKLFDIELP